MAGSDKSLAKFFATFYDKITNLGRANIEMGILHMRQGLFYDAAIRFKMALWFDKNNPIAHYLLGKAYVYDGKRDKAIPPLQKALTLDPKLHEAEFLLLLCGTTNALTEIPRSFVIERNDTVADNYERAFPPGTETKIATKLKEEFKRYFENWQGFSVLDIGCMGGEYGALIKEKANALVGTEPSIKMAAIARQKRNGELLVYNKVIARFAEDYLKDTTERYQVIMAIQYLSNFLTVEEFFKLVRACFVKEGGLFIFTITPSDTDSNRFYPEKILFMHSEKYVDACLEATGFRIHKKSEVQYDSGMIDLIYFAETV